MTDIEILKTSINTLNGISVPVKYTEQIVLPILNVKSLLERLLAVVEENKKKLEEESSNENASESVEG